MPMNQKRYMKLLKIKPHFLYACMMGFFVVTVEAQMDTLNLGAPQEISARAMALGGSYTAVANDFSALYYNAAGLSSVKRHEFSFTLNQTMLSTSSQITGYPKSIIDKQELGIQSIGFLWPLPVTRGGLTFAFGYYSPRNFIDASTYNDAKSITNGQYKYEAEGTVDQYRFGFGLDVAPDVSLGLAVSHTSGEERIQITDSVVSRGVNSYTGWNLEPSLMIKLTPWVKLGASLIVWDIASVDEHQETQGIVTAYDATLNVRNPYQLKLGLSYQGNDLLVAADYKMNFWEQYRYSMDNVSFQEGAGYRNEYTLSAGVEKYISHWNTVLRGGYSYNNILDYGLTPIYNRHRVSAGIGFLLSGSVNIDLGYSYAFWESQENDLYIEDREQRAMFTLGYRY